MYQVDFPLSVPFFELFFAGDGFADAVVPFVVHEVGEVVSFGEYTTFSISVVVYASAYIGGDADVQYSTVFIRQDIDPTAFWTCACLVHVFLFFVKINMKFKNNKNKRHAKAKPV